MSDLTDRFPMHSQVLYDPLRRPFEDGTGEVGEVAGYSASAKGVYVQFDDGGGAKYVDANLLRPVPVPAQPEPAEAELEQAEYEQAVMAMFGLTMTGALTDRRAPTWIYSADVVAAIRASSTGSDALEAIEKLEQEGAIHPVAAQVAAAIASLEVTGHTVTGDVALHRVAGVHLQPGEPALIELPVVLSVIGKDA